MMMSISAELSCANTTDSVTVFRYGSSSALLIDTLPWEQLRTPGLPSLPPAAAGSIGEETTTSKLTAAQISVTASKSRSDQSSGRNGQKGPKCATGIARGDDTLGI